ncbi:hypothetical protein KXV68_002905, partial [Aspergillus fumigatus]
MPSSELESALGDYEGWFLVVKNEVRVALREATNPPEQATLFLAGDKVRCEEDLAGSLDELIRDNKGIFLEWTHWSVSRARLDDAGT